MTQAHHWLENYDPEVGLWWATRSPAHTAPRAHLGMKVHPGPDSIHRLLLAAEHGDLASLPVERVLGTVAKMRSTSDPGCLCWYWEDGETSSDSNASFFTGLGLIALWLGYRELLPPACTPLLLSTFEALAGRFQMKVQEELFHCLNVYMGDVVCAWLLLDILERPAAQKALIPSMRRAARYWLDHGFGFGEHMSDVYARVALQQLSLLLLFSNLPEELQTAYTEVFHRLLAIEDAFDGKPRVPTMRCSAFMESPSLGKKRDVIMGNYRDRIRPRRPIVEAEIGNNPSLEGLLYRAGWHELASGRRPSTRDVRVACLRGEVAQARVEQDLRLGSLTRFPLMPEAEFQDWGTAWQSFPVALWGEAGDWGYLQWEIGQEGRRFCYPSEGPESDPLQRGNPLSNTTPPIIGQTFAIQNGGDLLVLRVMPMIDKRWDVLKDRFRLVNGTSKISKPETKDGWSQWALSYPQREVSLHHLSISPAASAPLLCTGGDEGAVIDWTSEYQPGKINRSAFSIWGISLYGRIQAAPTFSKEKNVLALPRYPEEESQILEWDWGHTRWKVRLDPLSSSPFQDLTRSPCLIDTTINL